MDYNEIDIPDISKTEKKEAMEMEMYLTSRRNIRKNIRIKKTNMIKKRLKLVGLSSITVISMLIGSKISFGVKQAKGDGYIQAKFSSSTIGYNNRNYEKKGYVVTKNGVRVTLDDAVDDMIYLSHNSGLTDAEIHIGLEDYFNDTVADQYVPVNESEIIAAKENAYHEYELSKNKGVSR